MVRIIISFSLISFLGFSVFGQAKVILDTDPSSDPDDAGCMAMLHNLANKGECEILAIINSTNQKESSLCISAINHFYNRKAIPVGDYKGYAKKIDAPENVYNYHIANLYPRDLKEWTASVDGVALYREILASAEDTSITIIIIGTMHNFSGLLESEACQFSDLTGVELVREKVKLVVTMGGNFIDGKGLDRTNWGGADDLCEYTSWSCINEERNRMCRSVIELCPAPFMASGWEVGCGDYHNANYGNVITGQGLKNLEENHIIRKSYEFHFQFRGGDEDISRHSNDQCALHYAVRGEGANYEAFTNGSISLSKSGVCEWTSSINRGQGYIQKKRDKNLIAEEIEVLMMGAVMEEDSSPPTSPSNLSFKKENSFLVLQWDAATDPSHGSWVVAYNIYGNGQLIGTSFGRKFIIENPLKKKVKYEIKSVNVNALKSPGLVKKYKFKS